MPLLGDAGHRELVECLEGIASVIRRPAAIIVVSAHWEAPAASFTSGARPGLIYDYSGFPPESYEIEYPCPGNPPLAAAIESELARGKLAVTSDGDRGFDHGLFVPLKIMA